MAASAVKDVGTYLAAKQASETDKDLAECWSKLEELYNKKLWHQITLKLETFVKHPSLQTDGKLIDLYNNFIQVFENKMNPLSLVEILFHVVQQFTDKQEAAAFLARTEAKVGGSQEATALCKVLRAQIILEHLSDQPAVKVLIDEIEHILDETAGITPVHGRYYLLASQLYRIQGKHAEYYRTALRYLGCIELSELSVAEQEGHAFFLGLAALLGEGVYNIGELLAHPVLATLKGSENAWLIDLLYAFNSGDINLFEKMKPRWSSIADLAAHELKLRQKISLLCLMEMAFKRPAVSRQLTFEEIANEARLPMNEVELLVMKGLAQGLVKGAIDQVNGWVHITWVQPRVLDKQQISSMVQRLETWCKDVNGMSGLLESKAQDILTL
ncbi:26S proteasome non-ATPase regulatory subunit 13 [Bacillus rossius redtenbacheri]|uniref:26S proteasome non-ATPase regulatory subunit 13 n=1 Tax=Bacillus rossius redtenbacheri TaxID=93214 RepID=UPI002FDD7E12